MPGPPTAQQERPSGEPLMERDAHLERLTTWAHETVRTGRVVLVSGEAGVGKTTLVEAFLRTRPGRSPVLRGWCESLSTPRPLAALVDVAAQQGGALATAIAAGSRPPDVVGPLLRCLGGSPGTVLVLEDLHWADDATLDLLRLVSRRVADVAALVVVTYRDDEIGADHPLRVLLGDLGTRAAVRRLPLVPLTEQAVARLSERSDVDAGELFAMTAGNPFYVTEVLQSGAGSTRVPATVRDAVLARAARLTPPARRALDVAATIGTPLDLRLLAAVAGEDAPHLDDCVAAGVLRSEGGRVAFRHELGRRVVEDALAPTRRRRLHQAVLDRLTGTQASAARLAHHAEAAGDRAALREHADQAAHEAARLGAHREAAAQLSRVLAVLEEDGGTDRVERAERLVEHARECALSDQPAEALASAAEALRIWQAHGDALREGDTLQLLARFAWMSERAGDAEPWMGRAVEVLERLPAGPELARAHAQRARLSNHLSEPVAAQEWAERARELARSHEEPLIEVDAMLDLGLALAVSGSDEPRGTALMEEAVRRGRVMGADEPVARGLFQLGRAAWQRRRLAEAEDHLRVATEFCAARGAEMFRDYCVALRAEALMDLGHWDAADELAREAWDRTTSTSSATRTVMVCGVLGRLAVRRGTGDEDVYLDLLDARVRAMGRDPGLSRAACRAEAAWLSGRLPSMVDQLREAVVDLGTPGRLGSWQLAEVCWWLHAAGQHVEPRGEGPFVAQARGDWREAAEGWEDLALPYHRAQALAAADQEAPLRTGLEICRDLGAVPLGRRIARRLRRRGARDIPRVDRRPAEHDQAGLTGREQEVLLLLAEGLRDADIAERLVISPRTVHHHVASLRAKLAAPSRTAAVAAARRLGLLDDDTWTG